MSILPGHKPAAARSPGPDPAPQGSQTGSPSLILGLVWNQVAAGSKGLGDRRQRVKPERLLAHRLMLPPMSWQRQIAHMAAKLDNIKSLQAKTAAELDALLPSILDKAFKGEL